MKTCKFLLLATAILLTVNICVAQTQVSKIDSLKDILAGQLYEMKWSSSLTTANKILSLDTNAIDVYTARAMSYFNLKDQIKPDFSDKSTKKTRHYLTLVKLAKADLEKVIASNSTIILDDAELLQKVKNDLDSCKQILKKHQR